MNELKWFGGLRISEPPELLGKFSRVVKDTMKEPFSGCENSTTWSLWFILSI